MNHTAKCQLLVYLDDNPDDLDDEQLTDYVWLVEQQLQEVRQLQVTRRVTDAQENPIRP